MINSWSMLSDEMNSSNDGFTILSSYDEDTIDFGQHDFGITLGDENVVSDSLISDSPAIPWKYNEEEIVRELLEYIRGTYKQHYAANDENIQTLDFIEAAHQDGEAFCRDNILKYTSRYDKKGTADRDIMKIQHYSVLLKFFRNKNAQRETYNQ
jgi:hypothetical protein